MQPARTLKTAILTKARKRAITTRRSHVKVAGVKIRTSKNRANRMNKRRVEHWVRAKVVVEKITTIGVAEVSVVVRTTEVVVVEEEPTLRPRSILLMFRLKMIEYKMPQRPQWMRRQVIMVRSNNSKSPRKTTITSRMVMLRWGKWPLNRQLIQSQGKKTMKVKNHRFKSTLPSLRLLLQRLRPLSTWLQSTWFNFCLISLLMSDWTLQKSLSQSLCDFSS